MAVHIHSQCTSANSTWTPNSHLPMVTAWVFFFFSFSFFFTFLRIQFLYIFFNQLYHSSTFFFFFHPALKGFKSYLLQRVSSESGLLLFLDFPTTKAVSRFRAFLKALSREVHPLLFNTKVFLQRSQTLQFSPNYSYNDSFILSLGYI